MGRFNPDDYVTVATRKNLFFKDYIDGRIVVDALDITDKSAKFKATIFKSREDQALGLPLSTGYAQEIKGAGGPVNNTSWTENCEQSAIGRALANAGFAGSDKCSREEMVAAQRNAEAIKEHTELFNRAMSLISGKTDRFKDKDTLERLLDHLQVKSSEDVKNMSIEDKKTVLAKLGDFTLADIQEPVPTPEDVGEGVTLLIQNGKHRGKRINELSQEEATSYLAWLDSQAQLKEWQYPVQAALIEFVGDE